MKRFALIGVAGFVAPRHLQAVKDTGNTLVAALDKSDSVGVMDSYFPGAEFFVEFERFDRHLDKLRRGEEGRAVDYVSICSPNYLHDSHIRFALRSGAHAVCEKPLVLNPWNVDPLAEIEREMGKRVNTVLQLRLHPSMKALFERVAAAPTDRKFDVDVTYIAPRGNWYLYSWKGDLAKSGGIGTNIGIHLFDLLLWVFGGRQVSVVHLSEPTKAAGFLELERARVRWFLSLDGKDLPAPQSDGGGTCRSVVVDGEEVDFSGGFGNLHTRSYEEILAGKGFGLDAARASIDTVYEIRNARATGPKGDYHPFLRKK